MNKLPDDYVNRMKSKRRYNDLSWSKTLRVVTFCTFGAFVSGITIAEFTSYFGV